MASQPNIWPPISISVLSARRPSLRNALGFILGALIVARIGAYIPIPGIDPARWPIFSNRQSGGLLGVFNMFSGGALGRMTIFALGIMPYISACIIIQLMTIASPIWPR